MPNKYIPPLRDVDAKRRKRAYKPESEEAKRFAASAKAFVKRAGAATHKPPRTTWADMSAKMRSFTPD